jgi:heterotetrameric sarcosine oxidase gamma subunit
VNKNSLLQPNIYRSEVLIVNDKLKLTLDNSRNIFSLNMNNDEYKKFNSVFKKFFSFLLPDITKFNLNDNSIVLWSRTKSYIAITNFNLKELTSSFENLASITDQTGGWLLFKLSGKGSLSLFEKLITINLDNFSEGQAIRTSLNKINCFVLCKKKAETYYIICPVSFSDTMKSRLIQLIELS